MSMSVQSVAADALVTTALAARAAISFLMWINLPLATVTPYGGDWDISDTAAWFRRTTLSLNIDREVANGSRAQCLVRAWGGPRRCGRAARARVDRRDHERRPALE